MDEAKSLVHMSFSAIFASMILMAVMGLITLGNLMWKSFAQQDAANQRLHDYAKYAAFDGTTVRGQDAISLIHDTQGDPYIIFMDKNNKVFAVCMSSSTGFITPTLNYMSGATSYSSDSDPYNPRNVYSAFKNDFLNTDNIVKIANSINPTQYKYDTNNLSVRAGDLAFDDNKSKFVKTGSKYTGVFNMSTDLLAPSYDDIQELFLNRGRGASTDGKYLLYHSYLMYTDKSATEIAGFILKEDDDLGGTP